MKELKNQGGDSRSRLSIDRSSALVLALVSKECKFQRSKNVVGGSCFGSPTTTNCPPRAIAPRASSGLSGDASSMTTTSTTSLPGSRYCATDKGLIMKQGLSAFRASP